MVAYGSPLPLNSHDMDYPEQQEPSCSSPCPRFLSLLFLVEEWEEWLFSPPGGDYHPTGFAVALWWGCSYVTFCFRVADEQNTHQLLP